MQTYQIDAWVSGNGTISLPNMPSLYNKEVQLVITPKEAKATEDKKAKENEEYQPVSEFLRKWSGVIKDMPDMPSSKSRTDELRYEYLKKKYDIDGSYTSDEDMDNARYEYLMEKYK